MGGRRGGGPQGGFETVPAGCRRIGEPKIAKAKEADELAELHKALMDAVRDYRRPTPGARQAILTAMDAYRAAWLGEPKETSNG